MPTSDSSWWNTRPWLWVAACALLPLLAGGIVFLAAPGYPPSGISQYPIPAVSDTSPPALPAPPSPAPIPDPSDLSNADSPGFPESDTSGTGIGNAPDDAALDPPGTTTANLDAVHEVLRLTNLERANYGLAPLVWNDLLAEAALAHGEDMSENDFFSHTGSDGSSAADRIDRVGYAWSFVGENLAWNQRTPAEAVASWMNSPGHRANILRPDFTELGVSLTKDWYWVQKFGTPR